MRGMSLLGSSAAPVSVASSVPGAATNSSKRRSSSSSLPSESAAAAFGVGEAVGADAGGGGVRRGEGSVGDRPSSAASSSLPAHLPRAAATVASSAAAPSGAPPPPPPTGAVAVASAAATAAAPSGEAHRHPLRRGSDGVGGNGSNRAAMSPSLYGHRRRFSRGVGNRGSFGSVVSGASQSSLSVYSIGEEVDCDGKVIGEQDSDDVHEGDASSVANSSFSSFGKLGVFSSTSKLKKSFQRRRSSAFRRKSDGDFSVDEESEISDHKNVVWSVGDPIATGAGGRLQRSETTSSSSGGGGGGIRKFLHRRRFSLTSLSSPAGGRLLKGGGGGHGHGHITVEVSGRGVVGVSNTLKPTDSLTKARTRLAKEFGGGGGSGGAGKGKRRHRRRGSSSSSISSWRRRSSDDLCDDNESSSSASSVSGFSSTHQQHLPLPAHFCFLYSRDAIAKNDPTVPLSHQSSASVEERSNGANLGTISVGGGGIGSEVPKSMEGSTAVAQCTSAGGRILLQLTKGETGTSGERRNRNHLPPATDGRVLALLPKARAVYLLCLRVLDQLDWEPSGASSGVGSGGGGGGTILPDVRTAWTFVEALATFASLAGPDGSSWAEHYDWTRIESGLFWIEDAARAAVRRACSSRLAAWWADDAAQPDRSELREAVACVKDAVRESAAKSFGSGYSKSFGSSSTAAERRGPNNAGIAAELSSRGLDMSGNSSASGDRGGSRSRALSAAAAILAVEFEKPTPESEALRKKIGKIRLRELKNPAHEELRKEIASFLHMSEAELFWEMQHRRLSGGSEDGDDAVAASAMVSGAAGKLRSLDPMGRRQSSVNLFSKRASLAVGGGVGAGGGGGDGAHAAETLEQSLAPHHHLEQDVIAYHNAHYQAGTGAWAMESFDNWVDEKNGRHRLYLLAAGAGFGKTTIASQIVTERDDVVVAHYFCRHDDRRFSCAKSMVLSIVYQLAQRFPQFRRRVSNILAKHGLNRGKLMGDKVNLSTIFTELVEIPLHSMKVSSYTRHVVVIDGLDESQSGNILNASGTPRSGSSPGSSGARRNSDPFKAKKDGRQGGGSDTPGILEAIQHYFPRFPSWLKLYVTTRPILPVLSRLKRFNAHMIGPDQNHIMDDMRTFFWALLDRTGLSDDSDETERRRREGSGGGDNRAHRRRNSTLEESPVVENLLDKSKGSFLYASIVSDKITKFYEAGLHGRDLTDEVEKLPAGLDQLLWQELFALNLDGDGIDLDSSDASLSVGSDGVVCTQSLQLQIVQLCVAAVEPLTLDTLEELTGCADQESLLSILDRSTAFFVLKEDDDTVHFRHNFVKEWLIKQVSAGAGPNGGSVVQRYNRHQSERRNSYTGMDMYGSSEFGGFGGGASAFGNSVSAGLLGGIGHTITGTGALGGAGGGPGGERIPEWKIKGVKRCAAFMASRCLALVEDEDDRFFDPARNSADVSDLEDTRRYVLNNTIVHLCEAKMQGRARLLLFDVRWLMARSTDGEGLVRDCDALLEGDQAVQLLRRAVQLSLPAVRVDPRQLAGQLVGRLFDSTVEGRRDDDVRRDIRALLDGLKRHDHKFSWWCPVSPAWERAELDFIRKLDGQDSAVQSVACDKSGRRIASGMWDGRAVVWDVRSGKMDKILTGHEESVWAVAWSPCDNRLATASLDRTVRVWDAETGESESGLGLPVLRGHRDHVWCVAWSSDGQRLASGGRDRQIYIWDASNGECERILEGRGGGVYSVSFEEHSSRLVAGGTDNCIYMWDVDSGDCLKVFCGHTDWVRSVVWHHDKILSGSADRSVRIWDAVDADCERVLNGHTDSVWSVAISNDGRHIVSGSTDKTVRVWDISVGQCEHVLTGHKGSVWSVSYTSDGKKVVSGSADTTITIWDAAPATSEPTLSGHGASVWSVDLSIDGKCLVSGSSDKTVRVWNTVTGFCTRAFTGQGGPVWSVVLSKDGRRVVSGSTDGTANVYNVVTGEHELELSGHAGKVWCVAWSLDCSRVISGSQDKSLKVWDVATGKCIRTLTGHEGDVRTICLSPDGAMVASGCSDKTVRIWRLSSGSCKHVLRGFKSGVLAVAWSPDGKYLAAGSSEKFVQVYSLDSKECEKTFAGHSRRINSVTWSPDGERLAAASTDKTIRIWSFATGECEQVISGHTGLGVYSVQWSRDGERLVSGGTDKTVRVWSASSGRCEHVLTGHTGLGIYSVAWSEDGSRLISGSRDRTVQVWDTDNGNCLLVLRGHTNWVYSVAWEKGGERIASVSDDNTCRIWDANDGECLQVLENTREIPADFEVALAPCVTKDLSGKSGENLPIGVQFDKVQVFNKRACAWTGKSVYFFKLIENEEQPC